MKQKSAVGVLYRMKMSSSYLVRCTLQDSLKDAMKQLLRKREEIKAAFEEAMEEFEHQGGEEPMLVFC